MSSSNIIENFYKVSLLDNNSRIIVHCILKYNDVYFIKKKKKNLNIVVLNIPSI